MPTLVWLQAFTDTCVQCNIAQQAPAYCLKMLGWQAMRPPADRSPIAVGRTDSFLNLRPPLSEKSQNIALLSRVGAAL